MRTSKLLLFTNQNAGLWQRALRPLCQVCFTVVLLSLAGANRQAMAQAGDPSAAPNLGAISYDVGYTTNFQTPVAVSLSATSPNGSGITYRVLTQPGNGTLSGSPPNLTYTPSAGFAGTDRFTFNAGNGNGSGNSSTCTIHVYKRIWTADPPIAGGEMEFPQDQTEPASTWKIPVATVSSSLNFAVYPASDTDTWWDDHNGNGVRDPGETGTASDAVIYAWSGAGAFSDPNSANTYWTAPSAPGNYRITCTINDSNTDERHDGAVISIFSVKVLPVCALAWDAGQTPIAAGSRPTPAHRATFTATLKDGTGAPLSGYPAPSVEVLSGGLAGNNSTSAYVTMATASTNAQGMVKGTLTSGNRVEQTTIGILKAPGKKESGALASILTDQVWNRLEVSDAAWKSNKTLSYDRPSPIIYHMNFQRSGVTVPIDNHHLKFITTGISGYSWDPKAGPDGDFVLARYDSSDPGFDAPVAPGSAIKRSDLVVWSGPNARNARGSGDYSASQTILSSSKFLIDDVQFDVVDQDAFDRNGDD